MKSSMQIERSIHPVGQGGFVTEVIYFPAQVFEDSVSYKIIYDCGSQTRGTLKPLIDRLFPLDTEIDLLFISHFDADHINGLDHLLSRIKKIRCLVLPLFDKMQSLIAFLTTGISSWDEESLKSRFKADKIIFIRPFEDPEQTNSNEDIIIDSSLGSDSGPYSSGTKFRFREVPDWIYVPFNVCENDRYNRFIDFLRNSTKYPELSQTIDQEDFDSNSLIDKKYRKELASAYKAFANKDRNKDSMVLYSGPAVGQKPFHWCFLEPYENSLLSFEDRFEPRFFTKYRMSFAYSPYFRRKSGALYTGDIDLKQKCGVQKVIEKIKERLDSVGGALGLIQIPHHGSKYNFTSDIFSIFDDVLIFYYSFGTKNRHGHPYNGIRFEMYNHNRILFEVFENPLSGICQLISK